MRATLGSRRGRSQRLKEIARRERSTAGAVISKLVRRALTQPSQECRAESEPSPFFGFRTLAANGRVVSNEALERLREAEGI